MDAHDWDRQPFEAFYPLPPAVYTRASRAAAAIAAVIAAAFAEGWRDEADAPFLPAFDRWSF